MLQIKKTSTLVKKEHLDDRQYPNILIFIQMRLLNGWISEDYPI